MKTKMRQPWPIYLALLALLTVAAGAGCTTTQPPATETATPPGTATPTPETPRATHTSAPPPTATHIPPPPTPKLPVLAGTPVPLPEEPISPDNVDRLAELAIWGRGEVREVAYSPDGAILAIGTTTGIWLHDAETLALLHFINVGTSVSGLTFSPSGERLFAGAWEGCIASWDVATGEILSSLRVREHASVTVAFSLNGTMLAALPKGESKVELWDLEDGISLSVVEGLSDGAYVLAFSPDGTLLAAGLKDYSIWLWDMQTATPLFTLVGHSRRLYSLAFSPDGRILASGASDGTVRLWDVETGALLHALDQERQIHSLAFSPDGTALASAGVGGDEVVRLWDVRTGALLRTLTGHSFSVRSVAFSPDGSTLASGSSDSTVRLWDPKTGASLGLLEGYNSWVTGLAISPDNKTVFVSHDLDTRIQLWDVRTGQVARTFEGHTDDVVDLSLSADGTTLASIEKWAAAVWLWDVAAGRHLRALELLGGTNDFALSPDGRLVALGGRSSAIGLYDAQTGAELQRFLAGYSSRVAFSPDGSKLASVSSPLVCLWDVKTGELLSELKLPEPTSGGPAFSPDGRLVAIGGYEGVVWLWSTETGEIQHRLEGYIGQVTSLAFSPDGGLLAAGVRDHVSPSGEPGPAIRLRDMRTKDLLYVSALEGYMADVYHLSFSSDGTMLVSGSSDGTVRLWGVPPD